MSCSLGPPWARRGAQMLIKVNIESIPTTHRFRDKIEWKWTLRPR